MAGREDPRDDRAPVVTRDMSRLTTEGLDERTDIIDQVIDGVALLFFGRVGEAVSAKVGRHREVSGLRQRVDLTRPRLCSLRKPMQEDEHVTLRRAVDHRPEPKTDRPHHVLARCHPPAPRGGRPVREADAGGWGRSLLLIALMNLVATSRASSRTASRP